MKITMDNGILRFAEEQTWRILVLFMSGLGLDLLKSIFVRMFLFFRKNGSQLMCSTSWCGSQIFFRLRKAFFFVRATPTALAGSSVFLTTTAACLGKTAFKKAGNRPQEMDKKVVLTRLPNAIASTTQHTLRFCLVSLTCRPQRYCNYSERFGRSDVTFYSTQSYSRRLYYKFYHFSPRIVTYVSRNKLSSEHYPLLSIFELWSSEAQNDQFQNTFKLSWYVSKLGSLKAVTRELYYNDFLINALPTIVQKCVLIRNKKLASSSFPVLFSWSGSSSRTFYTFHWCSLKASHRCSGHESCVAKRKAK